MRSRLAVGLGRLRRASFLIDVRPHEKHQCTINLVLRARVYEQKAVTGSREETVAAASFSCCSSRRVFLDLGHTKGGHRFALVEINVTNGDSSCTADWLNSRGDVHDVNSTLIDRHPSTSAHQLFPWSSVSMAHLPGTSEERLPLTPEATKVQIAIHRVVI